jgi:DNA-binding CsgD family transcriptional regulator/tetratricopeptide (TPR) repeat protein
VLTHQNREPVEPVGRQAERARLADLLTRARATESDVLVLHGEAGIGKTKLLDWLAAAATDFQVLRANGIEVEQEYPFAGVHTILAPFLSKLDELPGPQRDALDAAFGLGTGRTPTTFLVGLAALTVLTDAATTRPVLCVIDDAQWIDTESLAVLAFAARRVRADAVAFAFGVRDSDHELLPLDAFEHLELPRLSTAAATSLLEAYDLLPRDAGVISNIIDQSLGNPLALLEVGRQLNDEQRSGISSLPDQLALRLRLERRFLTESELMSRDAQLLLLIAAADGSADAALVIRAARAIDIEVDSRLANEVRALVSLEPDVAFRHPLIRSALYRGAPVVLRQAVHRALAEALDPINDADRRAWHQAEATPHPDERVAAELERSATRARNRGGYSAEATFRARAADLSVDPQSRKRRLLAACRAAVYAGATNTANNLWQKVTELTRGEPPDAEALSVRGALELLRDEPRASGETLLLACEKLVAQDPARARAVLLDATMSLVATRQSGRSDRGLTTNLARLVIDTTAGATEEVPTHELILQGWALHALDRIKPSVASMQQAVGQLSSDDLDDMLVTRMSSLGYLTAMELWDERAAESWLKRVEATTRRSGAFRGLRVATLFLGAIYVLFGRFDDAAMYYAETVELTRSIDRNFTAFETSSLDVDAWRGNDAEVRAIAEAGIRRHVEDPERASAVNTHRTLLIVLDVAAARYEDALPHAVRLFEEDVPRFGVYALPNLVEIAVRTGDDALAARAMARLEERAEYSGTRWALGLLALSRALMATDSSAGKHYGDAIALLRQTLVATDLARAELLYGEWLRRQKRRVDAREHLREAFVMFDRMGARVFADRAARELSATGGTIRRDPVRSRLELTPQETHVAQLAAGHATNREIGAQLFISANTVDYHLRKVFQKLGVKSRRELSDALASSYF